MIYSYNNKRMRWRWRYRNRANLCLVGMRWNIVTLFERSKTSSKQIQRAVAQDCIILYNIQLGKYKS